MTDASTTIYQYDPNGVRVSSKTNGVETRYLLDSNRPHATVLLEYDVNGNSIVDYTYGIGLISQQRGSLTAFYHADGLGSTRFLTDSLGNVTDSYIYDAYGNTLSSSGTTVNNYLYTGEQFDSNLGEYYLRARYYNPSAGRFTGRDPFDGMLEEPLSLNKYAYVHGKQFILSAWASEPAGHGENKVWYDGMSECDGYARRVYKRNNNKQTGGCDEYPFFSSEQGGITRYRQRFVSLRLVPAAESDPQGALMDTESKVKRAGVIPGDNDYKWYGVVPIPSLELSFWRKRDGNILL